jgi:PQQ-dependent dehydrogenase (s-GDH family)
MGGVAGSSGIAGASSGGEPTTAGQSGSYSLRVLAEDLESPWEISWGPDNHLWITERTGKRVLRLDPATGARRVALTLEEVRQSSGQDGLLGLALHPELLADAGADHVYLAYTYEESAPGGTSRYLKVRRYTFDGTSQNLIEPFDVLTRLPASSDHNSGRLRIGPDQHLYLSIGDQGANQLEKKCQPIRAQELPLAAELEQKDFAKYQGKILRMRLDGAIPPDNPVLGGVRSHVFSYGHRNAQGIAFGPGGELYSSEQGPKTDDELNRITAGKNYGWPHVAGHRDDKTYVYGNWSASSPKPCSELAYSDYSIPESVPQQQESEWNHSDFTPPLSTFYTVDSSYDFEKPECEGNEFICWPTLAPSSLEVYAGAANAMPGWSPALLMTSLKRGSVFKAALNADGRALAGEVVELFETVNRYRDLAVHPNGRIFYVITDNSGMTLGADGGPTSDLDHNGGVLEFEYSGAP